jgi:rhomboid-like protein
MMTFNRFGDSGNGLLMNIVVLNVGVFGAWQLAEGDRSLRRFMNEHFTVSPGGVKQGKVHTLVTAMFSHESGWHLFANMFTLYFFGAEALALLGARQFLILYLGGGTFSSMCHVAWPYFTPKSWPSRYSYQRHAPALGASGAVGAAIAYAISAFPTRIIYVYMVVPIPAAIFGLLYIANDAFGLYDGKGQVGNAAHLGGAAYGLSYFALSKLRGSRMRFRR